MSNTIEPLTPTQVATKVKSEIPGFIIVAVNQLLVECKKSTTNIIVITQDQIVERGLKLAPRADITRQAFFSRGWLDFEELFNDYGWSVEYVAPFYHENSDAPRFIFRPLSAD